MKLRHLIMFAVAALSAGCERVTLSYATRAEAAADKPFARGWLPEIIPASSRAIVMKNDLDLNLSEGAFDFDAADHDGFTKHLTRVPALDEDGGAAYTYGDWTFRIAAEKNRCEFRMRMRREK